MSGRADEIQSIEARVKGSNMPFNVLPTRDPIAH